MEKMGLGWVYYYPKCGASRCNLCGTSFLGQRISSPGTFSILKEMVTHLTSKGRVDGGSNAGVYTHE
jgi:hypothetical protein